MTNQFMDKQAERRERLEALASKNAASSAQHHAAFTNVGIYYASTVRRELDAMNWEQA